MKIRLDFVTNSSSSSFMVLALNDDIVEKIFDIEKVDKFDNYLDEHDFKVSRLTPVYDGNLRWLCMCLSEHDLRSKTLNQLEIELVEDINEEYGLGITIDDIYFDFDVIYD